MNYLEIRKKYPDFYYNSFVWKKKTDSLEITYNFSCQSYVFQSQISVKLAGYEINKKISDNLINNFVFNLGLVEMLNYWKLFCSSNIFIKAGKLNDVQKSFWRKLILKGMAQYFFENKIDFTKDGFININDQGPLFKKESFSLSNKYLLGIGGGKDSAVCIDILRGSHLDFDYFAINPILASEKMMAVLPKPQIKIIRQIDPLLFNLKNQGFLNGHVPFSSFVAFSGLLAALLSDHKYFLVGNESDANEENITWQGQLINHQYSKTYEFEKDLRAYVKKFINDDIQYLSLLRPWTDLKIAQVFAKNREFWPVFLSCNVAQRHNSEFKTWCSSCSKCLFTYLILYPFINDRDLQNIFGRDLFTDSRLISVLDDLVLTNKIKPFECVGMRQTSKAALFLCIEKAKKNSQTLPLLLLHAQTNLVSDLSKKEALKVLKSFGKNFLPAKFKKILKDYNEV